MFRLAWKLDGKRGNGPWCPANMQGPLKETADAFNSAFGGSLYWVEVKR